MKTSLYVLLALVIIAGGFLFFSRRETADLSPGTTAPAVTVNTGSSSPATGTTTNNTNSTSTQNTVSTADIKITAPRSGQTIASPFTVTGSARGNWFFEASAPVYLQDESDKKIAQGIITAQGDWMTTNFVPFTGTLTWTSTSTGTSTKGFVVFMNDNPSGLASLQKTVKVPVFIAR
jgi:hypothetical protein